MPEQEVAEARKKLDTFLVDNIEFEQLTARLEAFNLFRVLGIERVEIRHSNVLAWLLTPGESHGLGAMFLRRFLSRLLMENDGIEVSLSPARVELMRFDDVEVFREWKNVDILVRSRAGMWCLLIENKIGSSESEGQLVRYRTAARQEWSPAEVIPVLLTLGGDEPSEEGKLSGYVSLTHAQILELASQVVEQNRSRIPEDAGMFLRHYLETLRRLTMQDQELVDLCKTIYRRHRDAIDLIVEYGAASQVLDACHDAVKQMQDLEVLAKTGNRVWFVHREMASLEREVCTGWKLLQKRYPVAWWFHYRKRQGKLQLSLEVGPMASPDIRRRLLERIKDAGFSFWEGGFRDDAKYTRVLTEVKKLQRDEDDEPRADSAYVSEVTSELWKRAWGQGHKIVGVLQGFDWGEGSALGN